MDVFMYICAAVIGYLLGSMSIAIIITSNFMKKDVRELGSKNAGATNVARVFGLKLGVITLLGDMLKAVAAMLAGYLLQGENGLLVASLFCLIGHCWPVYYKFKGGKGVAVGGGIMLVYDWRAFLILLVVFAVVFIISRRVSLCSICAAITYPIAIAVMGHTSVYALVFAVAAAVIVIFMHHGNISRLIKGTEPVFKPKSVGE